MCDALCNAFVEQASALHKSLFLDVSPGTRSCCAHVGRFALFSWAFSRVTVVESIPHHTIDLVANQHYAD